jgi:hypothetical protein
VRTFDDPQQSGKVQSEQCSFTYHMRDILLKNKKKHLK